MPLFYPPAVNPSGGGTSFVIYYSSIDEEGELAGKMWCIVRRLSLPLSRFSPLPSPTLLALSV